MRFPCRKSPEPPLRRGPKSGVSPAGMSLIVAVSDGVHRKTKNNLAAPPGAPVGRFFRDAELFAEIAVWPCTVGKWAISITSSTCC